MRVAFTFACVLLASTVGASDLVVRQRTSTGVSTTPNEETVYLMTDTIVTDSQAMRTIIDLDKRTITAADKTKRTYTVLTFDELSAQMDSLRNALKSLPPEARKQMGSLLDDSGTVTNEPTGKTIRHRYLAKEHALRGGAHSGSIWTTGDRHPADVQGGRTSRRRVAGRRGSGAGDGSAVGFPVHPHRPRAPVEHHHHGRRDPVREAARRRRRGAAVHEGEPRSHRRPDRRYARRARSASPVATVVSSSPPRSRSAPKRSAKSRRTAGTNAEPPVRKTVSTSPRPTS